MGYRGGAPVWVYKNQIASEQASHHNDVSLLNSKIKELEEENSSLKKRIQELEVENQKLKK
jgi:predicted RNase H-like nuclease (RuvC/YqgF family)